MESKQQKKNENKKETNSLECFVVAHEQQQQLKR